MLDSSLSLPLVQHITDAGASRHTKRHFKKNRNMDHTRWKSTILFFSMDALGHIHPILSIVEELRRRGHRAIILTTRPLNGAKRLQDMGFELEHCDRSPIKEDAGANQTSEEVLRAIMMPLMENFRKGEVEAYMAAYRVDGAVGRHLDDMIRNHDIIEAKMKSFKPDLVVYDHVIGIPSATTVAPRWVRVYSGFPSALYSSINDNYSAGFGLKWEEMDKKWKELEYKTKSTIRQKLREFWKQKGFEDWPMELDLTPTSPFLNFYLGPRELGIEQNRDLKPLPRTWFRLEHTINDDNINSKRFRLPEHLSKIHGKLIYFSLGTLVTCDTDLINRLLKILSRSANKFIVSMGQMHKYIKLYPNMSGEQFVDQREVLKRADLFITHGGHNSIIEAFYYGVPGLIVLPVFADQFDSAQRVEDCGFGYRLNPFSCTEDALLRSIDMILANGDIKRRMLMASSRLRSIKYHQVAADKLEQLMSPSDH